MTSAEHRRRAFRRDAPPWGDQPIAVDLPGGPYYFSGLSTAQSEVVQERYRQYLIDPSKPPTGAIAVHYCRAADGAFERPDLRGMEYPLHLEYLRETVSVRGFEFEGSLSWVPVIEGRVWTSVAGGIEFLGVFENFFRSLVAYALLSSSGALLHGAAIVDRGRAFIFCGRSGAGKSTLSRIALASGRRVLCDDLNAVRRLGAVTVVDRVPFTGEVDDPEARGRHPAHGLLALEKGDQTRFRAVSEGESLASLLVCSPFVNADPFRGRRLESNLVEIQRGLMQGVLTFRRESDFDEIMNTIEGEGMTSRN
jgi:hypothetical protein